MTGSEPGTGEPRRGGLSPEHVVPVRVVHDLRVPMRDGVELALDLLVPDLGRPLPVVLVRTPYDKTLSRESPSTLVDGLVRRGYVVAFNDVRGRFNSGGTFVPYVHEADDGHDTVEWIASRPWCNGRVGMIGGSYAGQTQWFAAMRRPPHLDAIVPTASPPACPWRNEPIVNGVLMLGMAEWGVVMGRRSWQVGGFRDMLTHQPDYLDDLPVSGLPERAGASLDWWSEWMEHPTYDEFWERASYDDHAAMAVPALHITGWWDLNFPGAPLNFEAMRARAATPAARAGQQLLIGPWPHAPNRTRALSGVDFGEHAVIALDDCVIRFLDRWLKGVDNGVDADPRVHVFVTGANEWWASEDFPPAGSVATALYLRSDGAATTHEGDGRATFGPPTGSEPPDHYDYDPHDTARIPWSIAEGPVDDRFLSARDDVLCYTSDELTEPLDVVGWVSCRMWVASSAPDTDWHVRLVDVYPDGVARFLCHGAVRARFRESFTEPTMLTPGEPTLVEFSMDAAGVRFLAGHRIRVEVSSSCFPRYDRNLNTGSANPFTDSVGRVAHQTVFHDADRPSHVVLPVVPNS